MLTSVNSEYKPNFKALQLTASEAGRAQEYISRLSELCEKEAQRKREIANCTDKIHDSELEMIRKGKQFLKNSLFSIFEKHFKEEAGLKTGMRRLYEEVLAEIHLIFSELLHNINNNPNLEYILYKLNNFKPSKYTKTSEYVQCLDAPIHVDDYAGTIVDFVTENNLPKPQTAGSIEKTKHKLNTAIEGANLPEITGRRIRKRMEGAKYKDIAAEENVGIDTVSESVRQGKLRIKVKSGAALPPKYQEKVRDLANILGCSEEKMLSVVLKHTKILSQNTDTIKQNIDKAVELLGCTREEFINAGFKNSTILYYNSETIYQHVKDNSEYLKCSIQDYVKLALKLPILFTLQLETLKNNVETSSELLGCIVEDFVSSALTRKFGAMLCQKPATLNNNAKKSAELLGISKEQFVQMALKHPPLFSMKPEKLRKNSDKMAKILNMSLPEYINKVANRPVILTQKPETLEYKMQINSYYQKVKKEKPQKVLGKYSNDRMFSEILAYLIQQLNNGEYEQFVKVRRDFNFKNFLKANADKNFCFEIPEDKIAADFVKFVQETSVKTIGTNIFDFKIVE